MDDITDKTISEQDSLANTTLMGLKDGAVVVQVPSNLVTLNDGDKGDVNVSGNTWTVQSAANGFTVSGDMVADHFIGFPAANYYTDATRTTVITFSNLNASFTGNISTHSITANGNLTVSGTVNAIRMYSYSDSIALGPGSFANSSATSIFGFQAGAVVANTSAYHTFIGAYAGNKVTTALYNVAVGYNALANETTGGYNTCVGSAAGGNQNGASLNCFFGTFCGSNMTTGGSNVGMGYYALYNETTGIYNVAIGRQAGFNQKTAQGNVFIGGLAAESVTTGGGNIAIGYEALYSETTGYGNVSVGYAAGQRQVGQTFNVFIGEYAGIYVVNGSYNLAMGYYSLGNGNNCAHSTILGAYSGYEHTDGINNTYLGYNCGRGVVTGSNNTIIGANVTGLANTAGSNVIVADGAGVKRFWWDGTNLNLYGPVVANNSVSSSLGELGTRDKPRVGNNKTTAYTLALTDRNTTIGVDTGGSITIPADGTVAWPSGANMIIINVSASNTTITPAAGVTLHLAGTSSTGTRTLSTFAYCNLLRYDANTWIASGTGVS